MEDPKQKPYFFLPYKDDLSYKDMAEWAFLAAQSLPLTDSRNSSFNFFAIEELSEKGSQLCIAEAILLFFLRGYWVSTLSSFLQIFWRLGSILRAHACTKHGEMKKLIFFFLFAVLVAFCQIWLRLILQTGVWKALLLV